MKSYLKISFISLLLIFTGSMLSQAEEKKLPVDNSSTQFKRIKELAGKWEAVTSMFGKKEQKVYTEYKVVSNGSAVVETIFSGTPHEMLSVYYDNDGKLAMTHYCSMRNRSTFKLENDKTNSITLKLQKIEGPQPEGHPGMGDMVFSFKNKNAMTQTYYSKGKNKHEPMVFNYKRVSK